MEAALIGVPQQRRDREAQEQGARTAVVCKSLLGKAHTVMAEGGIAAAMGNVYPEDDWKVERTWRKANPNLPSRSTATERRMSRGPVPPPGSR